MQEPLRSVFNFLQLLGRQDSVKSDREASQYVTYAMENIKKLKNWISDFLSISRLRRIDNNSRTRLKDIIHEIQLLLRYQIDNRDCIINVDDTIPPILCTKPELLSVFKNLIENSLKHAIVEDSLVINIHKAETKTDDQFITLIFEDNGTSVSSNSINDGFGISISMEIARLHNGFIRNISDGGGYYRYEITLPI
jgi:light-regulated signal transduction histidine kinase (bacteriophytochrome)